MKLIIKYYETFLCEASKEYESDQGLLRQLREDVEQKFFGEFVKKINVSVMKSFDVLVCS